MTRTRTLFDEPSSALGPEMIDEVPGFMAQLAQEGMTPAVTAHEMGFAKRVANRAVFMGRRQLVEDCSKDAFFGAPRPERARGFLQKIIH